MLTLQTEENATLLQEKLLDEYPHLTVIKSISKSYGIPGLRLGIAASGNKDRICLLKKRGSDLEYQLLRGVLYAD